MPSLSSSLSVEELFDGAILSTLLTRWPVYAILLMVKGKYAVIQAISQDHEKIYHENENRHIRQKQHHDHSWMIHLISRKTALIWLFLMLLTLQMRKYVAVDFLFSTVISTILVTCVVLILASIIEEAKQGKGGKEMKTFKRTILDVLGVMMFFISTAPFTIPWLLAFSFPNECLFFFTAWAAVGAIYSEVSVLLSYMKVFRGGKNPTIGSGGFSHWKELNSTTTTNNEQLLLSRKSSSSYSSLSWKLDPKTHTMRLFNIKTRSILEDFLISDEGLRWWASFLVMQSLIASVGVFMSLIFEVFLLPALSLNDSSSSFQWVVIMKREIMWLLPGYDPNVAVLGCVLFFGFMGFCCVCESFWLTYAVGGRWLHFRQQWKFMQPFLGGSKFMILQTMSWTLFGCFMMMTGAKLKHPISLAMGHLNLRVSDSYSLTVLTLVLDFLEIFSNRFGFSYLPNGSAGLCGIFAELIMLVSLPLYKGTSLDERLVAVPDIDQVVENEIETIPTTTINQQEKNEDILYLQQEQQYLESSFAKPLHELVADSLRTALLSPMVLTMVKPEVILFLWSFGVLKILHGAPIPYTNWTLHGPSIILATIVAYIPTYSNQPHRTGNRRFLSLRGSRLFGEIAEYFYTRMSRDSEEAFDPNQKYIFGYAPHGLLPLGLSWFSNTSIFMELFPGIVPYAMSATITHLVPLLRDFNQFFGGIEVTRQSFVRGLERFKAVALVPGGQHEMLLVSDDPNEHKISTKHTGFIQLALQAAAEDALKKKKELSSPTRLNLVPVFAFGEYKALRNVFPASIELQRWFVSKFRVNPALLPVGRFNLAGVCNRVPIHFVIGKPIQVPICLGVPTDAQVALLHRLYYSKLLELFNKYKLQSHGYEKAYLTFVPELEIISDQDFEKQWKLLENDMKHPIDLSKKIQDDFPIGEYILIVLMTLPVLIAPWLLFDHSHINS